MLSLGSYVQNTVEFKRAYLLTSLTISELSKKYFCVNLLLKFFGRDLT